jgi:hypothetical protein
MLLPTERTVVADPLLYSIQIPIVLFRLERVYDVYDMYRHSSITIMRDPWDMSSFLTLYRISTLHFARASTRPASLRVSISGPCKFSRREIKGNGIKGYARAISLLHFFLQEGISTCIRSRRKHRFENYTVLCISSNSSNIYIESV